MSTSVLIAAYARVSSRMSNSATPSPLPSLQLPACVLCFWPHMTQCVAVWIGLHLCWSVSRDIDQCSQSISSSASPSVLTFASARVLASVFSSASNSTSPSVLLHVSAFDYATASLGVLISAFASNWPRVTFTVLISTLDTVLAQAYTTFLASISLSVTLIASIFTRSNGWQCVLVCTSRRVSTSLSISGLALNIT